MTYRVLAVRLDSLGDVLLTGPAIRDLARNSDVTLLCSPRGAAAAALLPDPVRIMVWDALWIANPALDVSAADVDRLVHDIRLAGFDEAVIFTSFHQSPLPTALLLRLAGIPRISGASIDFAGSLLDVRLIPGEDLPEDIHETERARRIAAAAGFIGHGSEPLRLPTRALDDTPALPAGAIALHPGASVPARQWPLGGFIEVAQRLLSAGRPVVVTGGPEDRTLTATLAATAPGVIDLGGRCRFDQLAEVLRQSAVLVAGNTGPAHLAAAVGTPVVSLFAPVVSATRWAPIGVPVVLLGDQDAPCRGTRARACPVAGHPCLSDIRPSRVVEAVDRLAPISAVRDEPLEVM